MSNYINDLYDGKIYPAEQVCANSEEYHLIQSKLADLSHILEEKLNQPLTNVFEDFLEQQHAAFSIESQETFRYGFKLGVNFMIEALMPPPKEY